MECAHHYIFLDGNFKCKKCGHIRHGKNRANRVPVQPSGNGVRQNPEYGIPRAKPPRKPVWLGSKTGLEFEDVCYNIFRGCGFDVKKIGGSGDGGRDLLIWTGSSKIVVECKHHKKPVGRPVVQKLHSATITEKDAVGGMLVSTGGFSAEATGHPHARTDPNVLDSIIHIRRNDIILVDLAGLQHLASKAGMVLHDGMDPAMHDVQLNELEDLFAKLKSSPVAAKDLVRYEKSGFHVNTCWVVNARLEQDFYNSANRLVHRMRKKRTYTCGSDGRILDGKLAKLVMSGGDAAPKGGSWRAAREKVVSDMKRRYKKDVTYKGGNGISYHKICKPDEHSMHFDHKSVGVKQTYEVTSPA